MTPRKTYDGHPRSKFCYATPSSMHRLQRLTALKMAYQLRTCSAISWASSPALAVRYDHVRQTGFLPWQVLQTDSLSFKPMRFTNRAISPDLSCNQTFCPSPVLLGLCLLQPISGARVGIIERGNTKSGRSEEFCSLTGGCVRYTA